MATAKQKPQRGDGTKVQWTGALCDFYDASLALTAKMTRHFSALLELGSLHEQSSG